MIAFTNGYRVSVPVVPVNLAEGVETTDQMDHFRTENVNQAQGFLVSRPLDPYTLETQLLAPTRPKHATT